MCDDEGTKWVLELSWPEAMVAICATIMIGLVLIAFIVWS